MTPRDPRDADLTKDLDATLRTRGELGEEYEPALIDSFLEKVDRRIDGVVERRVRRELAEQRMAEARGARPARTGGRGERFGFGVVSLVLAVPLTAVAVTMAQLPGLVVAWAGIVGVNVAQAVRADPGPFGRRRRAERDGDREA
ncbi:hypothetical protein [Streptomyces tropicalis]|uniref:Integral membrane protein n=1 Tax=Streptomyces tropicalis TaxID=3034234 RepID=A0ABT6AAY2_9ACTN|nr:hypothetical protein [Streptomyces tropicalis]MDF3301597.1 hypothetical protein [Streptomyces tropicalis]